MKVLNGIVFISFVLSHSFIFAEAKSDVSVSDYPEQKLTDEQQTLKSKLNGNVTSWCEIRDGGQSIVITAQNTGNPGRAPGPLTNPVQYRSDTGGLCDCKSKPQAITTHGMGIGAALEPRRTKFRQTHQCPRRRYRGKTILPPKNSAKR